uniref:Uncharacterized protein n=1 Tax=Chenopodium quinoa TaxID=63459 RepID=A0A803NBJ4_CHEQI
MSNFLKRIDHEKADEILEYEFDEVNFKWKTPRYTLDCGVFAMIHMMCFSGENFDYDLDLANRRKKHKDVTDNMSFQCYQVIDYLAINDGENFPNKSEVVGWFIDSIETVRQDCNAFLNEWKVSSNVITAWSNHLNNIEMEKDRSENDLIRYCFGYDFMVYDGANGIGLGTITEDFARLNHHHIRLVLDLLLNERNQMKQKLLTNVEDWEEKKESEQM